ncbi:MAG: hypothetical protein LN588_04980 [Rickettsia endosymbiont of Bryobia graminum]|nr:hypothetical protein [Rickettsia endosymbiont of Bryobia graminum]
MLNHQSAIIDQLLLCISARYTLNIKADELKNILNDPKYYNILINWYNKFYHDIFDSKNGYPIYDIYRTPYTEYLIDELLNELKVPFIERLASPSICLSHDIDNLSGSIALTIKSLISERKFRSFSKNYEFITSISSLLSLDAKYSKRSIGASTLFIAMPRRSKNILTMLKQMIIDPTYNHNHPLFKNLLALISEFKPTVGIHGSFFSISEHFFNEERIILSNQLSQQIRFSRQHWLNLPLRNSFSYLKQNNILMDSSIGWNGNCGFRGGMARPFQLLLDNQEYIWVMPMILMDGALLDLKLDKIQSLNLAIEMLEIVHNLKGCVSINWHDRAAHEDYGWSGIYEGVLSRLEFLNFQFLNMDEIYNFYAC